MSASEEFLAIVVVQAAGAAFVALCLLAAASRYGRPFLRSWAISGAALTTFILSGAMSRLLSSPGEPSAMALAATTIGMASKIVQAVALMTGVWEFLQRPLPVRVRYGRLVLAVCVVAATVVLATASLTAAGQYAARMLLPEALCVTAFLYASWFVGRFARTRGGIGAWVLTVSFLLLGLEEIRQNLTAIDQLTTSVPTDLDWLGLVHLFLDAGWGVGAIAFLLEGESAERAASAERAQAALSALSESERRQRLVLENIDEVIWSFTRADDTGGLRLTSLSGRSQEILGHEADHLLAHPALFRAAVHPDDLPRIDDTWSIMDESRQPAWYHYRLMTEGRSECRWIEERVSPQFDAAGVLSGVFGVSRDVTDRKRAEEALRRSEEQVRQSQKMEAVGRLAGGIAHDFNNVLTVISGHTDLLLETLPHDDPRLPDAKAVQKAAERATALVRHLLVFSRRQMLHPQVLDLRELLGELHTMLVRLIGEDTRISTAFDNSVGRIKADRSQIEQVVVNLVVNARDAMPQGGAVVIEVRDSSVRDEPVLERLGAPHGSYLVLGIHDTGVGITPETREQIFEPFFTTKEPGKGTGLGLATVYGIVRQSGGYVDVRSEAGRGASFSVYLPRVEASVASEPAPTPNTATKAEPDAPASVILVVEDEDAVRAFVVSALRSRGYVVLQSHNGHRAIELVESHKDRIDLLLTDVVMPSMRGPELAKHLLTLRPDIRIAFMTGYTDDATWKVAQATGHVVLAKPCTADALFQGVRDALQGRSSQPFAHSD